jgi:hypothetical protein
VALFGENRIITTDYTDYADSDGYTRAVLDGDAVDFQGSVFETQEKAVREIGDFEIPDHLVAACNP